KPHATVKLIPTIVYRNPVRPARRTSLRFVPKPRPTTETCSSSFDQLRVNSGKGFPKTRATASPSARASGGEAEYAEAISPAPNANLLSNFNNQDNRGEPRLFRCERDRTTF